MPKITFVIEDLDGDGVKVTLDSEDSPDLLEIPEEDLTAAQHLAREVFAFISTIEAQHNEEGAELQ